MIAWAAWYVSHTTMMIGCSIKGLNRLGSLSTGLLLMWGLRLLAIFMMVLLMSRNVWVCSRLGLVPSCRIVVRCMACLLGGEMGRGTGVVCSGNISDLVSYHGSILSRVDTYSMTMTLVLLYEILKYANIIPRGGVYPLLMHSRSLRAQNWMYSIIIRSIREYPIVLLCTV